MKKELHAYFIVAAIAALVLCLDQYTKYLVCEHIPRFGKVEVVPGCLDLVHIRNTGIAFGLLQNIGNRYRLAMMLFAGLVTVILVAILAKQISKTRKLQLIALSMILGGAVGNLIDRIRFEEVVDFIDVHWRNLYHWPAFNMADAAISIGVVLILIDELFLKKSIAR